MPTITLRTGLAADLELEVNDRSALARYFKLLSHLGIRGLTSTSIPGLTLDQAPLKQAALQLTTDEPIPVGHFGPTATIAPGAGGWVAVFTPDDKVLFGEECHGEPVPIAPEEYWLQVGCQASLEADLDPRLGEIDLGFVAGTGVTWTTALPFRRDVNGGVPVFREALERTLSAFTVPATLEDLDAMPVGAVATAEGYGRFGVEGAFDFALQANPLADLRVPRPVGPLAVRPGAHVEVTAAVTLRGHHQRRVIKGAAGKVTIGFCRKRQDEWSIATDLGAGVRIPHRRGELLSLLLSAISPDPQLDREVIEQAGLPPEWLDRLEQALARGIDRKLELALAVELSNARESDAAFVFEVALGALDDAGREAVTRLLRGDIGGLAHPGAVLPRGVSVRHTALARLRQHRIALRANLFGIVNAARLGEFLAQGRVLLEPETGDWIITDEVTATEILSSTANLAHRSRRLRELLAQSFLVSCAMRAGLRALSDPELSLTHLHFAQHGETNRQMMKDDLDLAEALDLIDPSAKEHLLGTCKEFGPTLFFVEARYTDAQVEAMFLDDSAPRPLEHFEAIGRAAMARIILPDDPDNYRRAPFVNDRLWAHMKKAGQFNFRLMDEFRPLGATQLARVIADYSLVSWWARAMHQMAVAVADLAGWQGAPDDPELARRREELVAAVRRVAAQAVHVQFGDPWGVVAMYRAAGRAADLRVVVAGQRLYGVRGRGPYGIGAGLSPAQRAPLQVSQRAGRSGGRNPGSRDNVRSDGSGLAGQGARPGPGGDITMGLTDNAGESCAGHDLLAEALRIGHDFNNMLTALLGNLALVRAELRPEGAIEERLAAAEQAAERARELAGQLLALTRGGEPVERDVALPGLLRDAARAALHGSAGRCDFEIQPDLWGVRADPGQVAEALEDLVREAARGMAQGGTVAVRAENVEGEPGAGARTVRVTVAAPGVRARAFSLPAADVPQAPAGPSGTRRTARPRILVMDDEPLIREVIGLYLARQGYTTVLAREGTEAVSLYSAALDRGERFDAVIMDLTVPGGMGGAEAIRHLRDLDPQVRAIVASGYTSDPVVARHREYGFEAALSKPFHATELAEALGAVLA